MTMNVLNQNFMSSKFGSFISTAFGSKQLNNSNNNSYYAKKGEPMYRADMDSDNDGIVSFDDFREYCKSNNISAKDMSDMIEMRMAYRLSQNTEKSAPTKSSKDFTTGNLDLIYAKDGDGNYDVNIDTNKDSQISYIEYLRYCEENAKMEAKNSDTKVVDDNKNKFMTVSFGHASNAYNRLTTNIPEGKIESKI